MNADMLLPEGLDPAVSERVDVIICDDLAAREELERGDKPPKRECPPVNGKIAVGLEDRRVLETG